MWRGVMWRAVRALLRRLAGDCRGNMVLFAAAMLVLVVAVGAGVDYGRAVSLNTRLAAAGHAAALAAVSQQMMAQDPATAQAMAGNLFAGQVAGAPGLVFDANTGLTITVTADTGGGAGNLGATGNGRQAVVRWNASYTTLFGGLLGAASLPLTGSATASADGAADVAFTVALAPASQPLQQAAQALVPVAQALGGQNGAAYTVRDFANGATGAGSYAALLSAVNDSLPAPGDGATPGSAQQVVVLVTDGSPGVPGADDLAACNAIKARGIVLAVLYAPVVPTGGGGAAEEAGQACASPAMGGAALFLEQAPGQSTADALAALFAVTAANARLVH